MTNSMSPISAGFIGRAFADAMGRSMGQPIIIENRAGAGVSTAKRSPLLPEVPTTSEAGAPNSDYALWVGMFAPAKTPPEIIARLNLEAMKAANSPELKDRLTKMGADAMPGNPSEFDVFVRKEIEVSGQVARRAKMQAN